ncbi:MAG: hypothetical protein DYG87_03715 [Anaerolineae bacterium CFX3]|jgi:hypothetical protein|nr:hypothetical protein [Anaerolineales bacterium]MCE7904890.1 hypothetical protein [Anaerolineae bacterium CFX3]MCQ3945746.1 hypothetical protein [Anaerolineae bacterium]OQY83568.1 MAG: hypothetical protein B6D40_06770 [Anaerolineae bacterium UTCFX3]MBW7918580.1 hypothetical protein [Anaerolineales bacterium]
MKAVIREHDWRGLMSAVIVQAVEDAKSKETEKALDAALWLVSEDVPLWLEAVGLDCADTIQLVTSGKARKARTSKRR